MDSVARFMGHRNPQTTAEVYVAMSEREHRQTMIVPWLRRSATGGGADEDDDEDVRRRAIDIACALCGPFGSDDGRTFPSASALGLRTSDLWDHPWAVPSPHPPGPPADAFDEVRDYLRRVVDEKPSN